MVKRILASAILVMLLPISNANSNANSNAKNLEYYQKHAEEIAAIHSGSEIDIDNIIMDLIVLDTIVTPTTNVEFLASQLANEFNYTGWDLHQLILKLEAKKTISPLVAGGDETPIRPGSK